MIRTVHEDLRQLLSEVRRRREMLGMTQAELAEATGMSTRSVGNIEAGRTKRPHPRTIEALRDALAPTGRPLGQASGGYVPFWDRLGVDMGGMPKHLPMGVTQDGQGPEADQQAHHYVCWCADVECPLTLALGHAWRAGTRAQ